MENNNVPSEEVKTEKINIGNYKKADDILTNDRLIKLYSLLPDKESKIEFLETLLGTYEDRLSEKFDERLADEFEASDYEIRQGQLKENIKNKRSITDIIRSRRRKPLREGVTERVNYLVKQMQEGNYVTKEDRDFLVKHLAARPIAGGIITTPSARRDEIRSIIDDYIKARNEELKNNATKYTEKQRLERLIQEKKSLLASTINYNPKEKEVFNFKTGSYDTIKTAEELKQEIKELEEMRSMYETTNSMLHPKGSETGTERNTAELEQLMEILDRECKALTKKGVKLPETGIKEDEVVEIEVDVDKEDGSKKQITSSAPISISKSAEDAEVKETVVTKSNDVQNRVITPEEIEQVVMIDPRALKVIKEAADTKQLVGKTKDKEKTMGEI